MRKRKEALCGVVLALGLVMVMFGGCLDEIKDRLGMGPDKISQEECFEMEQTPDGGVYFGWYNLFHRACC
jgi:hypothetical protein